MSLPLAGISVLDLTQIYNGPYAAFLLVQAGAEVVKVEPPGGEHLRRRAAGGFALPFASLNGGKRSVRLDLKQARGRDVLRDLAMHADVLVENFAPGVMDRLGLGAEALQKLNPRLVYACSSGFGSEGPYRDYPAMDLTVQAMAGYMGITGFADTPPTKCGPAVADFLAGAHLYGAVVTALLERERTGVARRVEVSMLETAYFPLLSALSMVKPGQDADSVRVGNRHSGLSLAPYSVYPCADGFIAIITSNEAQWQGLCRALEMTELLDDPRSRTVKDRCANMDWMDATVAERTIHFTKQALFEKLLAERVPSGPVRTLTEVMHDPHLHATGGLRWQEHPEFGRLPIPSGPLHFSGVEPPQAPPTGKLGAETREVLREKLGLDAAAMDALAADGVI
jgi:CoA:oxalate CoA-transferase